MNNGLKPQAHNLDTLIKQINARGGDVEIRTCKGGTKVYEIKKTLVATIPLKDSYGMNR